MYARCSFTTHLYFPNLWYITMVSCLSLCHDRAWKSAASPDTTCQELIIPAQHGGPCSASITMAGHSMSNKGPSSHCFESSPTLSADFCLVSPTVHARPSFPKCKSPGINHSCRARRPLQRFHPHGRSKHVQQCALKPIPWVKSWCYQPSS